MGQHLVKEVVAKCMTIEGFKLYFFSVVSCPSLTDLNNGVINCSLGDDGVPSYEDTCSFTCNTGYELTGSDTWTCQRDGSWSSSNVTCRRGMLLLSIKLLHRRTILQNI